MGLLQNGKWVDKWYDTKSTGGSFQRTSPQFRSWITKNGSPRADDGKVFKAEPNRYHLYVSLACPWAHRTLIMRVLKGLENIISVSVVHWYMVENGWTFNHAEGVIPDNVNNVKNLHEIYTLANPNYSGRVTVPVLWDKKQNTIVSNESSEIIRMFNSEFDGLGASSYDYYPQELRKEIDIFNERIYRTLNNGVYRCGFATTQKAYENAIFPLFETLDWLEEILSNKKYLSGNQITEADWRLFTTLIRFDPVYVGHFKCNLRRIADYPALSGYLRELYQMSGIAKTVVMPHIKTHYYASHGNLNPTGIVPKGPILDFLTPHGRQR